MVRRRVLALLVVSCTTLVAACGGGGTTDAGSSPSTDATTAVTSGGGSATTEGRFVDLVDASLEPYEALVGQPADASTVASALPAFAGVPMPAGLTIAGAGRATSTWDGEVTEDQTVSFAEPVDAAALEQFAGTVSGGWRKASSATSGSLTTVLLLGPGGERVSFVADAAPLPGEAALRATAAVSDATMPDPGWMGGLPRRSGGELVEVVEGVGSVSLYGGPAQDGMVFARWRYPASARDALNAELAGGAIADAGFTYDADGFNGFESLVEVTAGGWTGSVLVGEALVDDEVAYDLVWSLTRP